MPTEKIIKCVLKSLHFNLALANICLARPMLWNQPRKCTGQETERFACLCVEFCHELTFHADLESNTFWGEEQNAFQTKWSSVGDFELSSSICVSRAPWLFHFLIWRIGQVNSSYRIMRISEKKFGSVARIFAHALSEKGHLWNGCVELNTFTKQQDMLNTVLCDITDVTYSSVFFKYLAIYEQTVRVFGLFCVWDSNQRQQHCVCCLSVHDFHESIEKG